MLLIIANIFTIVSFLSNFTYIIWAAVSYGRNGWISAPPILNLVGQSLIIVSGIMFMTLGFQIGMLLLVVGIIGLPLAVTNTSLEYGRIN